MRHAVSEMEISRLATGQPTPSRSEDGCDPCCSRLPHNGQPRMKKLGNAATPVAGQCRRPPVRVTLLRADGYAEQTAPPDGESKDWWSRLNKALGTVSTDFVRASLLQLQGAARSPYGTISEMAINAALAMIEGRRTEGRTRGRPRGSDGLHPHGSNVRACQDRQRLGNGTTDRGVRVNRGSFNEGVCDATGSSPPPAYWRAASCPR